jgi:hypothetical protein
MTKGKKALFVILMVLLHIVTTFYAQDFLFGLGLTKQDSSILEFVMWYALCLVLLGLDYFVCKVIIDRKRLRVRLPVLLHISDLLLILPILLMLLDSLFLTTTPTGKLKFGINLSMTLYEWMLTAGIFVYDALLIAERILLIRHNPKAE